MSNLWPSQFFFLLLSKVRFERGSWFSCRSLHSNGQSETRFVRTMLLNQNTFLRKTIKWGGQKTAACIFNPLKRTVLLNLLLVPYQTSGDHLLKPFGLGLVVKVHTAHQLIAWGRTPNRKTGRQLVVTHALQQEELPSRCSPWPTPAVVMATLPSIATPGVMLNTLTEKCSLKQRHTHTHPHSSLTYRCT